MATWIVQTRTGLKAGLTAYQVQQLVRTGETSGNDPARPDGSPPSEWHRVRDIPGVDRQVRLLEQAPAAAKALDEATVDAMLESMTDERYRRQLRRLVLAFRIGAALILTAEAALFVRYFLPSE